MRQDCTTTLQSAYYAKNLGPLRCVNCSRDISEDEQAIQEMKRLQKEFQIVHPSCGDCDSFITKRPHPKKKTSRKRRIPAGGAQPRAKRPQPDPSA